MNSPSTPPFHKALPLLIALLTAAHASAQGPTVASLGGSAASVHAPALAGNWRLVVPPELRQLAGQVNLGDVTAELTFKGDGSFVYVADGAKKTTYRGKYTLFGNEFLLARVRSGDNWPTGWSDQARGNLGSGGSLTLEGLSYGRNNTEQLIGLWVLQGDKGTRFELRKDGTFLFKSLGSKAESKGRWEANGGRLKLQYTEVDGEKVDFDMRSKADVADTLDLFVVSGRFRYVRVG